MNLYEKIPDLIRENQSFVIATVTKTTGSVPGKTGFKMVVTSEGKTYGTVGGGELEQQVKKECLQRIGSGESGLQEYILQEKKSAVKSAGEAQIVPMMCNGRVWIFYDVPALQTPVYLFGGGHVGQALSYFMAKLNYRVILVDNREEFISEQKNPYASERIFSDYIEYATKFKLPKNAFVIIMTQGHGFDYEILEQIYRRKLTCRYIGIIASSSKAAKLLSRLQDKFGNKVDLSNIYTPIGLDIGGNTESEIALSIAAEIQAINFGKNVPHLRT
jgi:xanthine dehydrogenase accessory factor